MTMLRRFRRGATRASLALSMLLLLAAFAMTSSAYAAADPGNAAPVVAADPGNKGGQADPGSKGGGQSDPGCVVGDPKQSPTCHLPDPNANQGKPGGGVGCQGGSNAT